MGSGTTAKMALLNNRNYIGFEINEEYYNGIIKRMDKFKNSPIKQVEYSEINIDGEMLTCQVSNPESEKDIEEKTKLFNKLVHDLNTYFNEQSLGILKNLTLTFKSSANDKRVKKILEEKTK